MGDYVTPQGYNAPTVESILAEINEDQRSEIDPLLNTDPDDPIGEASAIVASHVREAHEVNRIAYNANDPNSAEGDLLEKLCAITGTKRAPATRSKFTGTRKLKVHLDAGTTLLVNRIMAVAGNPSVEFQTTEEITAVGTGFYYVSAECTQTGPIACNANTLTVIVTAVVGWNSVTNEYDAVKGQNQDNDAQLRDRRERELRATGSGTVDSIQADLIAYEDDNEAKPILDAVVLENVGEVTDVNGLPPKSMEALVFDGVSQDVPNNTIAQILWNSKPGGIKFVGNTSGTAKDSRGQDRVMAFSRPDLSEVLFVATLTLLNPNQTPSQYAAVVKEAIIAEFARRVKMGGVVRCNHYERVAIGIDGIDDCLIQVGIGVVGAVGVNLDLDTREMGYVQTSGITVQ